MKEIDSRNTFLVLLWSYGLFMLMNFYQYLGIMIAAWGSDQSFETIISNKYESAQIDFIISLTSLLVGVPLVFLVTKFLWGRSSDWMRLQFNLKPLIIGLIIGFLLPIVILQILKLLGIAKITWLPKELNSKEFLVIIGYACVAIFSGIAEEVVFRGMAVREIAMKYGWLIAAIIGGVFFGVAHLVTMLRDITIVATFWILLASTLVSFLFVAMYRRSQSLWLPIGFHMAWNFCLKGVMGITMSGNDTQVGLLNVKLIGSSFLTGGNFGIEASSISLIVYILVALLILSFPWSGHFALLSNR
jgi:membrane protease YdiL (CAAX protease family)